MSNWNWYYCRLENRCIGCGLCISSCSTEALRMVAKPDFPAPPDTYDDTIRQNQAERMKRRSVR